MAKWHSAMGICLCCLCGGSGDIPPLTATVYAAGNLACDVFFSLPRS